MIELQKPSKRGPKPRKRIQSKGRKRTPTRRKRQLSLKKECAVLWSRWVKRADRCQFLGAPIGNEMHMQCANGLQAMHGFPKGAYPGVRYAVWNGFAGCGRVHSYYSWREPEWQNFLRSQWGHELYEKRLAEAMLTRKYDLEQVAETFKAALSRVEP